jgi:hypothetical protein
MILQKKNANTNPNTANLGNLVVYLNFQEGKGHGLWELISSQIMKIY